MTLIKYCGNRSLRDVQLTAASNAHYIGFVFAESKRNVHPEHVADWLRYVDIGTKQIVGVFVHASAADIARVAAHIPLSIIQCHGAETVDDVRALKEAFQLPVWKAIHHREGALAYMRVFAGVADGFVIDSGQKGAWGGTGKSFDWRFVPLYMEEAKRQGVPCFIAGGISPHNIADLLRYQPIGIDISSGIEENEQKSEEKIKMIEQKVRTC
jgi:phosphoribosylanthranilate isomerase